MNRMAMTGLSAALASMAAAGAASASMLAFHSNPGNEGLGAFTGSMEWIYPADGTDCGQLVVSLTNTSPGANGGYLTGFGFNAIDGITVTYAAMGDGWSQIAAFDADPYGVFDWGTALDGDFLGGGSPKGGVAVGETREFMFEICADSVLLSMLNVEDFFEDDFGFGFVARFKGFNDEGSDKVTGSVPAPGAIALIALAGLAHRRRRG